MNQRGFGLDTHTPNMRILHDLQGVTIRTDSSNTLDVPGHCIKQVEAGQFRIADGCTGLHLTCSCPRHVFSGGMEPHESLQVVQLSSRCMHLLQTGSKHALAAQQHVPPAC